MQDALGVEVAHPLQTEATVTAGKQKPAGQRRPPSRSYLDHLLCDLSGLVNVQDNLGIPHHRVQRPTFTQAGRRGKE